MRNQLKEDPGCGSNIPSSRPSCEDTVRPNHPASSYSPAPKKHSRARPPRGGAEQGVAFSLSKFPERWSIAAGLPSSCWSIAARC